jgi:hypothetical protein
VPLVVFVLVNHHFPVVLSASTCPQHSVRRLPGSGQVQCTSWRNFAPFSSSTFKNIHCEQVGKRDCGGSAVGARHIVREHDTTTQPVLNKDIKRAQGVCPWSPSQEGARGQGSSACRGTPSRGEARALHHQTVPVLTLTIPCLSCSRAAPGQPNRERKHHDTKGNMITASSHVLFFYLSKVYPDGYIAVGYLLFLQEQIKDHHHLESVLVSSRKTRTKSLVTIKSPRVMSS